MTPHGCIADTGQADPAARDGATECQTTVGAIARGDFCGAHRAPPGAVWNGNPAAEPRRDPAILLDVLADRAIALADQREGLTRQLHAAMHAMTQHCRAHRDRLRSRDIIAAYDRVYARVERPPADEGDYDGDLLPRELIPDEDPGDADDNRPLVRI